MILQAKQNVRRNNTAVGYQCLQVAIWVWEPNCLNCPMTISNNNDTTKILTSTLILVITVTLIVK